MKDNQSLTLATRNDQTLFIFEATRVDDARFYENYSPTVATYWGTGGARVPYVFAIQGNMIGRNENAGPQGSGVNDDVMFTLTQTDNHAIAFHHKQNPISGDVSPS